MKHTGTPAVAYKNFRERVLGIIPGADRGMAKMMFKIFVLTSVLLLCEATIPDRLYYRRSPLRFLFNNQGRRPGTPWNYQIVNGRPVISGFPNGNSYVAFGLNPQTGQIEQTQVITQTRPGGPVINLIQNMLQVAGQFFGQLTGAFGNAVGGTLQTAGQFGQDIQDITNPVISVTGISRPPVEPIQQPATEGGVTPSVPSVPVPSTPSSEFVPEQPKSDILPAARIIDQAIITFQTFRTNVQTNLQSYLASEEGQKALDKVNENINWAVNRLQSLRETATAEPLNVLQSGQNTVNTAFDNVENALVNVAGTQGRDFVEPTRNEINKTFNEGVQVYQQTIPLESSVTEISPAK